jgi:tRNA-Thr(GGU) m(6)t(6)A37 methyltransferase TsaA
MTIRPHSPLAVVPIGRVESPFTRPTAAPPQASASGLVEARVVVGPDLVDGLDGLAAYEHIWLLTWLHLQPAAEQRTLRVAARSTEATGDLSGIFACRHPHRPNPIGLSLVRLTDVRENVLTVAGVDLIDGTPVVDIKPWFDDCDDPRSLH